MSCKKLFVLLSILLSVVNEPAISASKPMNTEKGKEKVAAPIIKKIVPAEGPIEASVFIQGENFGINPTVSFNGVKAKIIDSTPAVIVALVPSDAATGSIIVSNTDKLSSAAVAFKVIKPAISSIAPQSGPFGSVVTITGANFDPEQNNNKVYLGGELVELINSVPTQLTVRITTNAKSGPFKIITKSGTISSGNNFTITSPIITNISPNSGPYNTPVAIIGNNFDSIASNNKVYFADKSAVIVNATTNTITATVPDKAETGQIKVVTPVGTTVSEAKFIITSPKITGINPIIGPSESIVTISGANFDPDSGKNEVKFNMKKAIVLNAVSTQLTVKVPRGVSEGDISVTTPIGTVTSQDKFTVSKINNETKLEARIGSRTNFFAANNDNRTNPNFGLSLSSDIDNALGRENLNLHFFANLDFSGVAFSKQDNTKPDTLDLQTSDAIKMEVGLFYPFEKHHHLKAPDFFNKEKTYDWSTGIAAKVGTVFGLENENNGRAKAIWGVGLKASLDREDGFLAAYLGQNRALTRDRLILDAAIPISLIELAENVRTRLLFTADISLGKKKDDVLIFGIDLTMPLDNLKGFLSPILPINTNKKQ